MAETEIETAIESALLTRVLSFAAAQTPVPTVSLPNKTFSQPLPGPSVGWLKADILWAPKLALSVGYGSEDQIEGILQVTVLYGQGGGLGAASRIASAITRWFNRGTKMTEGAITVEVHKPPYRGNMLKEDPWMNFPVSIPFRVFAKNSG